MEGGFKKRSHRPWNNVLEKTVDNITNNESNPSLNLDDNQAVNKNLQNAENRTYREINFADLNPLTATNNVELKNNLEAMIAHKTAQKEELVKNLNTQPASSMLIGGFLKPDYLVTNSDNTGKAKRIMTDLKTKEQELHTLANNLKLSQVLDQVESLEIAKNIAEQAKNAAEERLKQSLEQAQIAVRQFHVALEKAQAAEEGLREEESIRATLEIKCRDFEMKVHSIQATLLAEQDGRRLAEEKAQQALNQIVQIELARQEADKGKRLYEQQATHLVPELKRMETQQIVLEQKILTLIDERNEMDKKLEELQKINLEQTLKLKDLTQDEQKLQEIQQQIQRLENIILTEKKLRLLAEQKAKDALQQAAQTEILRQTEEKQRKILDERAKRAITHANKTVMHFLNAPIDYDIEEQLKDLQMLE